MCSDRRVITDRGERRLETRQDVCLSYIFIARAKELLQGTTHVTRTDLLVEIHPPMVLAAEDGQIARVRSLVANVAQRLAARGGAGIPVVLALVPVPSVAGVDEREPLRKLFAASLLLLFLELLFESWPLEG